MPRQHPPYPPRSLSATLSTLMPKRIVIVGHGPAGKAVERLLQHTKYEISIECWDIDIKVCPARRPLEEIIPKADIIFLCIPSWAIRAAAQDLRHLITQKTGIISVSKGLDRTSASTVDELLREVFPRVKKVALLSGPMLATEILNDKPAAAVIASRNKAFSKEIETIFRKTNLLVMTSEDLRGVALCGILKNIYSIGLGAAQALHPGDNFRGMFAYATIQEMMLILKHLKAKPETALSYAGIGDLIATGFSKHSKNHSYGESLVRDGKPNFESEGSVSVKPLAKRMGPVLKKLPVFKAVLDIVSGKKDANAILKLFS